MAAKPLTPGERKQLGEFLGGILRGQVTLGFSSLGLVDMYHRARIEKISLLDLAMEDGPTQEQMINAIAHRIKMLPPKVFNALEHAVLQARIAKQPPAAPPPASAQSRHTPVTPFAAQQGHSGRPVDPDAP